MIICAIYLNHLSSIFSVVFIILKCPLSYSFLISPTLDKQHKLSSFNSATSIFISSFNNDPYIVLCWEVIYKALGCMGFPPYIRWILLSYLGKRVLHLQEDNRKVPVTMEVTYRDSVYHSLVHCQAFKSAQKVLVQRIGTYT